MEFYLILSQGVIALVFILMASHCLGIYFAQSFVSYAIVALLSTQVIPSFAVVVLSPFGLVMALPVTLVILTVCSCISYFVVRDFKRKPFINFFSGFKARGAGVKNVFSEIAKRKEKIFHATRVEGIYTKRLNLLAITAIWLAVAVAFFLKIYQLINIYYRPLLNDDVLVYHAPRIIMWAQNHSVDHFETWELRHNYIAKTGHFPLLVHYLYTKSVAFFELPQWIGSLMLGLVTAKFASNNGASKHAQALAAVVVLGLPIVFVQSVSAQTDLLCATYMLIWLAFYCEYVTTSNRRSLFIAAVAFAIAIGTKQLSIWFFAASIPFILWKVHSEKHEVSSMVRDGGVHLLLLLLLAAPAYIQNYIHYASFLTALKDKPNPFDFYLYLTGGVRYTYWLFDPSGLPRFLADQFTNVRDAIFNPLTTIAQAPFPGHDFVPRRYWGSPSPVSSWAGPLGLVLVMFGVFSIFSRKAWKNGTAHLALSFFVVFFINIAFLQYTTARGRYHIFPFAILSIILVQFVWAGIPSNSKCRIINLCLAIFLAGFSILTSVVSILQEREDGYLLTYTSPRLNKGLTEENVASFINRTSLPNSIGILPVHNLLRFVESTSNRYQFLSVQKNKNMVNTDVIQLCQQHLLTVIVGLKEYFSEINFSRIEKIFDEDGYVVLACPK